LNVFLEESTIAAIVNLLVGFGGAVVLSLATRRFGRAEDVAKISFALSSMFVILFCMTVVRGGSFALICIGLAGFGFFGFAGKAMTKWIQQKST